MHSLTVQRKLQNHSFHHRGLKKCKSCGCINGQRAQICRNENCELRKKALEEKRSFEVIQLVTNNQNNESIFSVRCKERDMNPRTFVHITEVTSIKELDSMIVTHNTMCFADTCKEGTFADDCKHIEAVSAALAKSCPSAEIYEVSKVTLFNLNIDLEHKNRLWEMYRSEQSVPAVQRLNQFYFAVSCLQTCNFPAGRLHVTAISDGLSTKKGIYLCACKKLKIILDSDNSVVMKNDVCDHILMVLSAVLSKGVENTGYTNFINALKSFWMPTAVASNTDVNTIDMSINIGGNVHEAIEQPTADDIFIFDDQFLVDNRMLDLSEIIRDLTSGDVDCQENAVLNDNTNLLNTNENIDGMVPAMRLQEEMDEAPLSYSTVISNEDVCNIDETFLQLSDCKIELMDEFQLTDHLDLCDENIILPLESSEFFDTNSINVMTPPLSIGQASTSAFEDTSQGIDGLSQTVSLQPGAISMPFEGSSVLPMNLPISPMSIPLSSLSLPTMLPTALPPIEMPTIAVVKKAAPKASTITKRINTRAFPHIPAKRSLIVNQSGKEQTSNPTAVNGDGGGGFSPQQQPSLSYSAWLEFVIETLNDSVYVSDTSKVTHCFHVHEEIFSHLCKTFSSGIQRRMPNSITDIKQGKYNGLIKYTWFFQRASTVRRIFSTENISLQLERTFECNEVGALVPYVNKTDHLTTNGGSHCKKHKRIYPKLELYAAYIVFDSNNEEHKSGFVVDWVPNAFPKSHFGIFNIEFSLGFKHPHQFAKKL